MHDVVLNGDVPIDLDFDRMFVDTELIDGGLWKGWRRAKADGLDSFDANAVREPPSAFFAGPMIPDQRRVILEKTLIVYLVDGDVNKITSTFTNGQVDDGHFDTIVARIKAIDVLRTIFTTRHAEIKQLDEATKKANVNKFTLGWFSRCDGNTVTPDSKEGNTPLIQ